MAFLADVVLVVRSSCSLVVVSVAVMAVIAQLELVRVVLDEGLSGGLLISDALSESLGQAAVRALQWVMSLALNASCLGIWAIALVVDEEVVKAALKGGSLSLERGVIDVSLLLLCLDTTHVFATFASADYR